MTLLITTISGLQKFEEVASIEHYNSYGTEDQFLVSFFNPKIESVMLDKAKVLLIQVVG